MLGVRCLLRLSDLRLWRRLLTRHFCIRTLVKPNCRQYAARSYCINTRVFVAAFVALATTSSAAQLQEVASFPNQQLTGVGVSQKSGRIFVNFPYWSDDHFLSVAEIVNDQPRAFPDDQWNKSAFGRTRGGESGPPGSHFVCVQSVVVDDQDNLWILDPAAPKMHEIVKGGPKLVKVDLATNKVTQTIPFGEESRPRKVI